MRSIRQGNPITTDIPLMSLFKVHHVAILLYAYLELVWVEGSHVEVKKIEYNSVGQHLIEREIDRVRALHPPCLSPDAIPGAEPRNDPGSAAVQVP